MDIFENNFLIPLTVDLLSKKQDLLNVTLVSKWWLKMAKKIVDDKLERRWKQKQYIPFNDIEFARFYPMKDRIIIHNGEIISIVDLCSGKTVKTVSLRAVLVIITLNDRICLGYFMGMNIYDKNLDQIVWRADNTNVLIRSSDGKIYSDHSDRDDRDIDIWDEKTGERINRISTGGIQYSTFEIIGDRAYLILPYIKIHVFNLITSKKEFDFPIVDCSSISCLLEDNGKIYVDCYGGNLAIHDRRNGDLLKILSVDKGCRLLHVDKGKVYVGRDVSINIWDEYTGELIRKITPKLPVEYSPNPKMVNGNIFFNDKEGINVWSKGD